MCELLVQRLDPRMSSLAYTAGMVSALDIMMGVDSSEVSVTLNLDEELHEASFGCTSPVARVVHDVRMYQDAPHAKPALSGLQLSQLDRVALQSLSWAVQMTNAMSESKPPQVRSAAAPA
jgi:EAL and modified HD-GYP domain-containing signal transduction protein